MTQQIINTGINPNDMSGDPLRTGFDKCNQNFTELYDNGYQVTTFSASASGNNQIYSKPIPNNGVIFGDVRVIAKTDTLAETIGLSILARTGTLNQDNFIATGVLSLGQGTIVGTNGYVATVSQNSGGLNSVAYGLSKTYCVGVNGIVLSSNDGRGLWNRVSIPSDKQLYSIIYAKSLFVIVGDVGTILTSPDGIGWTSRTSGVNVALKSVIFNGVMFLAVGDNGTILTSPDGIVWTIRISGAMSNLKGVTWGLSRFVVVGDSGTILTSPDGISWTSRTSWVTTSINSIVFTQSAFLAVGDFGFNLTGTTVTPTPQGGTFTANFSGNIMTITANAPATLAVGTILTGDGIPTNTTIVSGSGNSYTTNINSTLVLTSPDGTTWTSRTSGTTNNLLNITYANSQFVASGAAGTILTSSNGASWIPRDSTTTAVINDIFWNGDIYVGVDSLGEILTSSDLITWTKTGGFGETNNLVITANTQVANVSFSIYSQLFGD